MTPQQLIFLAIVAVTLILFISEKIRIDIAAMLTLLALAATGILTPGEALSGFAERARDHRGLGVRHLGGADRDRPHRAHRRGHRARRGGDREWRAILVVMPAVAALAAFSHHLMITAMMLPIMMRLARVQNLSPSRLLMPMSLAASLGTTLTIFSAPAFLLMNHLLRTSGQETLGVFGITPIGAALVLLAIVYMFAQPLDPAEAQGARRRGGLPAPRPLLHGADRRAEVALDRQADGRIQPVLRRPAGGRRVAARTACRSTTRIAARCWPTATCCSSARRPTRSSRSRASPGLALHAVKKYGDSSEREFDESPQLVQVVVAPHSPFIGETIAAIDFHKTFDVVVVGIWRRHSLDP